MQKLKSIWLLFIMGMILFPWQIVCVSHPFGHEHHEHEGPSLCELRTQDDGTSPLFWPPMDCEHIDNQVDEYQAPHTEKIKQTFQTVAVAAVLFDIIDFPQLKIGFIPEQTERNSSSPPITTLSLRGPPFV